MNPTGNCFEVAGRLMVDFGDDLILVHGTVTGQGRLDGVRFRHAWCEKGSTVIDRSNGREILLLRGLYYAMGNVDIDNIRTYTYAEFVQIVNQFGHWGPWDLISAHRAESSKRKKVNSQRNR